MLIDCHTHATVFPGPGYPHGGTYPTGQELRPLLEARGISRSVLLPTVNPEGTQCIQSVEDILAVVEADPDFFIPFMNLDPRHQSNSPQQDFSHYMQHYQERGCKGLGEICANLPFTDPLVENLFHHAEDNGVPVLFHMATRRGGTYGLIDELGLPLLEGALRKFPRLQFLAHSQAVWSHISGDLTEAERGGYPGGPVVEGGALPRLLREYDNLWGDLSAKSGWNALARDPEFGYAFLEEFQDRLLFGTDVCDANRCNTPLVDLLIDARAQGAISREVYEKVGGRNAQGLLGL
jgi:predicted TIM-barrel fold metal-dependent hydrolase